MAKKDKRKKSGVDKIVEASYGLYPDAREDPSALPVYMTPPRWRALAAVLYSALSITEDPTHRTILKGLYDDIESQVNVKIQPIETETQ